MHRTSSRRAGFRTSSSTSSMACAAGTTIPPPRPCSTPSTTRCNPRRRHWFIARCSEGPDVMAIFGHRAATPLGQLLLRRGVITQESLDEALDLQRHEKLPLGEALLAGGARQRDVWSGLAAQWGLRITNLDHHWVDPALANELDAREAIKHRILPLRCAAGKAVVAMADPNDRRARDYAEVWLRMRVVPKLATPAAIRRRQESVYRGQLEQVSSALLQAHAPEYSAHVTLQRT